MLRKMLKMYLKENSLDIVYYKNYGGDKENCKLEINSITIYICVMFVILYRTSWK